MKRKIDGISIVCMVISVILIISFFYLPFFEIKTDADDLSQDVSSSIVDDLESGNLEKISLCSYVVVIHRWRDAFGDVDSFDKVNAELIKLEVFTILLGVFSVSMLILSHYKLPGIFLLISLMTMALSIYVLSKAQDLGVIISKDYQGGIGSLLFFLLPLVLNGFIVQMWSKK